MSGDTVFVERTLPHNLDAERSILGAILLQQDAFIEAAETVQPQHFFRSAHREIFTAMCELVEQSAPIDFVTLREELTRKGLLDECGGPAYITALIDGMPRSTNITQYARIVREKSALRSVIHTANKMLQRAYNADEDAQDVIEAAGQAIFALAEGTAHRGFVSMADIVPAVMEKLEIICRTRNAITGVPTGFGELDAMTHGLQPGNLVLVAGRPSMGKTAIAINIAEHAALERGLSVGVFSLEQSSEELVMRQLAGTARIDGHRLQSGFLLERDWGRLAMAMSTLAAAKLHIDDTANLGVFEMRARARRLKHEHGIHLLVIDYVQLMATADARTENRAVELGKISRGLKILARELGIPIVLLSQLNRGPELRSDHRPMLADLRESGSFEQDADVVMFLYRDEYYHPDRDDNRGIADVIIAKQRNGPIGTVKLAFIREFTKFENLAGPVPVDQRLPIGDR